MPDKSFATYEEFWPYYLGEHSQHRTRMFHFVGTSLAIFALLKAIISGHPAWLIAALIFGYGFAWIAHIFVEKNRPATFAHPLWSLRGDFHMFTLWVTGGLESELRKYNITT